MAKLYHNKKCILKEMSIAKNTIQISFGLMFASKKRIHKGLCLVMPGDYDLKYGSAITTWFCFSTLEIIFVNKALEVVDKAQVRPWKMTYIPKSPCKYVIESTPNRFKNIKVGDHVEIIP